MSNNESQSQKEPKQKISLLTYVGTIFMAGLGVQTEASRQRDFNNGDPKIFIVLGIVFTILFIGTLVSIVRFALT